MTDDDYADQRLKVNSTRVQNPDDYNRSRRFEHIHDARSAVHSFIRNTELSHEPGVSFDPSKGEMLARLVTMYIIELIPLMEEAEVDGDLLSDGTNTVTLREFAAHAGLVQHNGGLEVPPPRYSLRMFSAANRFYRRAGLDLKLVDEPGDAGFDYSNLLENSQPGYTEESDYATKAADRQTGDNA